MKLHACAVLSVLAGCLGSTADRSTRIDVTEANALGVVALQTTHITNQVGSVYTLRGYTADQREVADVQLTIGAIPDIKEWSPDSTATVGSELLIDVAGAEARMVTLETRQFDLLSGGVNNDTIMAFLRIGAVTAALASEHMIVQPAAPAASSGDDESPYYCEGCNHHEAISCESFYLLNNGIVAGQCCEDNMAYTLVTNYDTIFVVPLTAPRNPGAIVTREHNSNCTVGLGSGNQCGCKAADGVSSCDGSACVYGPTGFETASVWQPPAGEPYGHIGIETTAPTPPNTVDNEYCTTSFSATTVTNVFSNITGTATAGCGCCTNGTGPCCGSACDACSASEQAADVSHWDY